MEIAHVQQPNSNAEEVLCKFCDEKEFRYVCPRCNLPYCSVACYKSQAHLVCSEAFYKENIEEMLKSEGADSESRRKMMEILQRVKTESEADVDWDSDSDDVEDIAERMAGVDLDDAEAVWSQLTDEERAQFIEVTRTGNVEELVPVWDPWWSQEHPVPKVRFADDDSEPPFKSSCPPIAVTPPLSSLLKTEPSPYIVYNLVNVVASYAFTCRHYNGDFSDLELEAATLLVNSSKNLLLNETFTSMELALGSVCSAVTGSPQLTAPADLEILRSDTLKILKGPNESEPQFYAQAALSDCISLLSSAKRTKSGKKTNGGFSAAFPEHEQPLVSRTLIAKCVKKIEFYLSWSHVYYTCAECA